MDIKSIRRKRLAQLISTYGSQAKFVEETGENQGEISALLKDKSFGEKKARKLETKCKLPAGWLDRPLEEEILVEPYQKLMLTYVNSDEMALLTDFREATEDGKEYMKKAAKSAEKAPPSLRSATP